MADGLRQRKDDGTGKPPVEPRLGRSTPELASENPANIDDARLPQRKTPISGGGIRNVTRWLDIVVASFVSWYCLTLSGNTVLGATVFEIIPFALIPFVVSWGLRTASAYDFAFNRSALDHMLRAANGSGLPLAALGFVTYIVYQGYGARWPILAIITTWLAMIALHAHMMVLIRAMTRAGRLSENVVIVGATPNAQRLIERNEATRELNIVGIFDDRLSRAPKNVAGAPLLGKLDDMLNWERLPEIDRIVVTITSDARVRVRQLIDRLRVLPQRVVLLLDLDGFDPESESLAEIARSPAAYVSGTPRDTRRAIIKRCADIGFAIGMLIAFSPLLIATAIAIKLGSKGPVFFRQRRHGFNNQIIRVWKFRSMRDDPVAADKMRQQTLKDDPRVTKIGRFIRKTSIDELPQLFNVIKGEMSIVGPRPHAVGMTTEETAVQGIVGDYAHRHRVKPGITGWAQINGSRGPVHTKELVRERVRLDMEYVNRSSFWFDLYIMIMTAPCLLGDATNDR
ncbi:MAG: exopolysaccharide biosynthesis polyprenyl glycosylphosphotransferase [Henriciella sp.]|jgi:Undecaprenyl-phosphate glucose phosphotransferase